METGRNSSNSDDLKKNLIERANQKYKEFISKQKDEKEEVKPSSIIDKAKSYAEAVVSRGLTNKHCSKETKDLRILSCHGDGTDALPPCSERRASEKYENSFYCGTCGCGDKKGTQLVNLMINGKSEYSKLDYPKVSCPFKMPGFTDYVSSSEGKSNNSRKKEIETRYGVEYITEHSNPK